MHLIRLQDVNHSEKALTQAVIQITQMLGIYHAELARILQLKCSDVGDLAESKTHLQNNTVERCQAEKLVQFYERLFQYCKGEEALMCNWLRRKNQLLQGVPLYLMVDEGRIDDVVNWFDVAC